MKNFIFIIAMIVVIALHSAIGQEVIADKSSEKSETVNQSLVTVSSRLDFNPIGKIAIITVTNNSGYSIDALKLVAINFDKQGNLLSGGIYEVSLMDTLSTQTVKPKTTEEFSNFLKEEAHQVKYIVKQAYYFDKGKSIHNIWDNPNYNKEFAAVLGDQYPSYLKRLGKGVFSNLTKFNLEQSDDFKETKNLLDKLRNYQKFLSLLNECKSDDVDLKNLIREYQATLVEIERKFYPLARQNFSSYLLGKWKKDNNEAYPSIGGDQGEILTLKSGKFIDQKNREKKFKGLLKEYLKPLKYSKVVFSWGDSPEQQQEIIVD